MAVTYGFYNSLNKDRVYNAEQMSSIFNGVITDGVFSTIGNTFTTVAGTGLQVIVKPGKAWFDGTWTLNDALLPLDIVTADVSLDRIDAVILEVNSSTSVRANSIKVLKGTASANPVKPTLTNTETVHQYALAYVTVAAGATSITAGNIEINVGKSTCPFVTSVLQQTNIDQLFAQWESEFDTWFANVQSQLSGDIAANLQRQIDACVKIADKATSNDIVNGSAEKWVDAISGFAIGDIKFSLRSSLNDNWHICDGKYVLNNAQNSDLINIIRPNGVSIGGQICQYADLSQTINASDIIITNVNTALFIKNGVLHILKDGVISSLEKKVIDLPDYYLMGMTGMYDNGIMSIPRIKHIAISNTVHYYYFILSSESSGTGGPAVCIMDGYGNTISTISFSEVVPNIYDVYINALGDIILYNGIKENNTSHKLFIKYKKAAISFSVENQSISLFSIESSSYKNQIGSLYVNGDKGLFTYYDGYSSSTYTYSAIGTFDMTINDASIKTRTLYRKKDGHAGCYYIVDAFSDGIMLLKDMCDSTFRLEMVSGDTTEAFNSVSYAWAFWCDINYIYFTTSDGIIRVSKTDRTQQLFTLTRFGKKDYTVPFAICNTDEFTTFFDKADSIIYSTGITTVPLIVNEDYNAFIRIK